MQFDVCGDVVWWWKFLSRWCLRFKLGQCDPNDGKITPPTTLSTKRTLVRCLLNNSISSNDEVQVGNFNYCQSKLKGKGRSEKWQIYLYGDQTIKVKRDGVEVLPRGIPPPSIGGIGFDPSTWQRVTPSTSCGVGMSRNLANPVTSGKYSGNCVLTLPILNPRRGPFEIQPVVPRVEKTVGKVC